MSSVGLGLDGELLNHQWLSWLAALTPIQKPRFHCQHSMVYILTSTNLKESLNNGSSASISRAYIIFCKYIYINGLKFFLWQVNGEFVEDCNIVQDGACSHNFFLC